MWYHREYPTLFVCLNEFKVPSEGQIFNSLKPLPSPSPKQPPAPSPSLSPPAPAPAPASVQKQKNFRKAKKKTRSKISPKTCPKPAQKPGHKPYTISINTTRGSSWPSGSARQPKCHTTWSSRPGYLLTDDWRSEGFRV